MKPMQYVIAVIFLLCSVLPLGAAGLEDRVVEHTLKNGLKLLMVERHTSPTVSAWIRFRVGSVDERSDERGIAHLLEHMLFKGTKTLGTRDYAAEAPLLEKIEEVAQNCWQNRESYARLTLLWSGSWSRNWPTWKNRRSSTW